jgi:hypothetical protein
MNEACEKINPQIGFQYNIESNITFDHWFEYLKFKGDRIKKLIHELIILNETIDSEFLQKLTFIDDEISMTMNLERQRFGNATLQYWSHTIHEIVLHNNDVTDIMRKKYRRYAAEYHEEFRRKRRNFEK